MRVALAIYWHVPPSEIAAMDDRDICTALALLNGKKS